MKPCIVTYLNKIDTLEDRAYLLNLIKYTASPTIDGVKSSTLMIFRKDAKRNLYEQWIKYQDYIKQNLNVKFHKLKETEESIHVLFYDPYLLKQILLDSKNIKFLSRFGYDKEKTTFEALEKLASRYSKACPHEVGVFLGYPVDDVLDFIYPSEKECLMKGYWKVYNDLEKAQQTFNEYDRSKYKVYKELVNEELKTSNL